MAGYCFSMTMGPLGKAGTLAERGSLTGCRETLTGAFHGWIARGPGRQVPVPWSLRITPGRAAWIGACVGASGSRYCFAGASGAHTASSTLQ